MDNTNIQLFTNELFGNVRSVIINGEPWFVGNDVAKCLGYSRTADALATHVKDRDKYLVKVGEIPTLNITSNYGAYIINEAGLYSLILRSKLPAAEAFQDWVTHEVLPTMRKIGFSNALQLLQQEVSRLQNENKDLHHQIDTFNALCENKLIEIHF